MCPLSLVIPQLQIQVLQGDGYAPRWGQGPYAHLTPLMEATEIRSLWRLSMGLHSAAKARYAAMMDLLVLRPRGWVALATVALVLLLPVALALVLGKQPGKMERRQ